MTESNTATVTQVTRNKTRKVKYNYSMAACKTSVVNAHIYSEAMGAPYKYRGQVGESGVKRTT